MKRALFADDDSTSSNIHGPSRCVKSTDIEFLSFRSESLFPGKFRMFVDKEAVELCPPCMASSGEGRARLSGILRSQQRSPQPRGVSGSRLTPGVLSPSSPRGSQRSWPRRSVQAELHVKRKSELVEVVIRISRGSPLFEREISAIHETFMTLGPDIGRRMDNFICLLYTSDAADD